MSRRAFIEKQGATCANWNWSWSFVNEQEKIVIFGAWVHNQRPDGCIILSSSWATSKKSGKRFPGYGEAVRNLHKIEKEGYTLRTFEMRLAEKPEDADADWAKIGSFTEVLETRELIKIDDEWLAVEVGLKFALDPLDIENSFKEGEAKTRSVTSKERNPAARQACLKHHGFRCKSCDMSFLETYGEVAMNFIHVHHKKPISSAVGEREVNPVTDLEPLCPNCHAVAHLASEVLDSSEIRRLMKLAKASLPKRELG